MDYDIILVRYGELSLKSTYVRKSFESALIRNIKKAHAQKNISCNITKERGRIYLSTTEIPKSCLILSRIFGVVSYSPAIQTTSIMADMSKVALQLTKNILTKEKSFAIRSTRVGTHTFSSQQVAIEIGKLLVEATHAKVNLNHPDVELFIEIRDKRSFLFTEKKKGVGGLPLGTQGKILALIENPFCLLATWYLMRRGCNVIIANAMKTDDKSLYSFLCNWYADSKIISVDCKKENFFHHMCILASENNCDAIVIGHILKQSAKSLKVITKLKQQSRIPILTPLIGMSLQDVQQQCKKRGIQL